MKNEIVNNIYAPELPESVINATIIRWYKKKGDQVNRNEILIEIETDKIVIEVPSPSNGILSKIIKNIGDKITSKELLAKISSKNTQLSKSDSHDLHKFKNTHSQTLNNIFGPKLRRLSKSDNYKINDTKLFHKKNDSSEFISNEKKVTNYTLNKNHVDRTINKVPMSNLRKCIAERLTKATNNMAMLTTFNEVNMESIIHLKNTYKEVFEQKYKIKLGIVSFFVKAVAQALKNFPKINASIDNDHIIYYNYFDVSIAIATKKGLITPVLKNVNIMSIFDIENQIKQLKIKGNDGLLTINDLIGGNITITNGGVFGSLMSTPIINPPQTAILGLHAIKNRPMAVNKKIKILPMMYLALSYDHRLIDGQEAISFLINVKNIIEDLSRIIIDV